MQGVIKDWFPHLKRLSRLRVLGLQYPVQMYNNLIPLSEDLEEERDACEDLRAGGCTDITKISFNPVIAWIRCQNVSLWKQEEWPKDNPPVVVEI